MKSERRHELEHNELLNWLNKTFSSIKPYLNLILGLAVFLAVIYLAYAWWRSHATTQTAASWNALYKAGGDPKILDDVITKYPRTTVAQAANLKMADFYLANGCNSLFENKSVGEAQIARAIQLYRIVLADNRNPLIREQAMFGLARACEANSDLAEAVKQYEELAKQWPQGAYATHAAAAIERLNKQSSKAWYDRFAKFEAKPAAEQPSASGKGAKSNLETLPEESPLYEMGKAFGSKATGAGEKPSEPSEPADPSASAPLAPESAPSVPTESDQTKP
jgi:hypothetical protein